MPPRTATRGTPARTGGGGGGGLLAKLAQRKQNVAAATAATLDDTNDADTPAAMPKKALKSAHVPARRATAVKQSVASSAVASAAPTAVAAVAPSNDDVDAASEEQSESESESDSDSSSSSESAPSSAYESSEDEIAADGTRSYRVFLCPIPSSCADAHTSQSSTLPPLDPYAVPPSPPCPHSDAISSVFTSALSKRFAEFGTILSVDIRSKQGFECKEEEKGVKKVAKGMLACRECLACPECREYSQKHFAYVNIRATHENVNRLLLAFNRTKWRGEFVRVEVAKPEYPVRSVKERQLMK